RSNKLPYSSINDRNPLKDKRVRQAISLAIDTQAINQHIMGGLAKPTGTLIAPQVNGYDAAFSAPYPFDLERAAKLLLDAGYPDRFSLRLACPQGRYVNDQAICQAVVEMMTRIGIQVDLADHEPAAGRNKELPFSTQAVGLILQSWTPPSMDAGSVLHALVACGDNRSGAGRLNR